MGMSRIRTAITDREVVESLPPWKRCLFAGVIILLPILALGVLELGARGYFWLRYGVPGKSYGVWRSDPAMGAIQKENGYNSMGETDNWGFRDREDVFDPKPPGSLRLIAYGGSTTYCYQLLNDEAWPARLEQLLRARRPGGEKDQVLNGGGVMWSIGQVYDRARRDLPVLRPDYVLIYSGINEAWNTLLLQDDGISMEDLVKHGRFHAYSRSLHQARWVSRELFSFKVYEKYIDPFVINLLSTTTGREQPAPPGAPIPYILENYLRVLSDLIQLAKDNGSTPVFIVQITGDPTPQNVYLTSYSRAGAKTAGDLGAIVIDPAPILEGSPEGPKSLFAHTGVHYSEPGARKLAAYLFDRLFGS